MIFIRKVQSGQKIGRKISSPTLNFHVGSFGQYHNPGVYSSAVRIAGKNYKAALYFGPKMSGKRNVLELFVFDFSRHIYGHFVSFTIGKKIRDPEKFSSVVTLKTQIQKDIKLITYNSV